MCGKTRLKLISTKAACSAWSNDARPTNTIFIKIWTLYFISLNWFYAQVNAYMNYAEI